jgi:hypothetical protein
LPEITEAQYRRIPWYVYKSEMYPNSTLHEKLVDYLVAHLSDKNFKEDKKNGLLSMNCKFMVDESQFQKLIDDPK